MFDKLNRFELIQKIQKHFEIILLVLINFSLFYDTLFLLKEFTFTQLLLINIPIIFISIMFYDSEIIFDYQSLHKKYIKFLKKARKGKHLHYSIYPASEENNTYFLWDDKTNELVKSSFEASIFAKRGQELLRMIAKHM